MKSHELTSEEDINKRLAELELKKINVQYKEVRKRYINSMVTLVGLLIIVLLGVSFPAFREVTISSITKAISSFGTWFMLVFVLTLAIIARTIRYRLER